MLNTVDLPFHVLHNNLIVGFQVFLERMVISSMYSGNESSYILQYFTENPNFRRMFHPDSSSSRQRLVVLGSDSIGSHDPMTAGLLWIVGLHSGCDELMKGVLRSLRFGTAARSAAVVFCPHRQQSLLCQSSLNQRGVSKMQLSEKYLLLYWKAALSQDRSSS